jgi:hypothetical protein
MPFKHIDMESVMRRVADRRIEEAMREGKFDNLPGAGKPLELEDMPASEDARLLWWALRLLKQNDVIPEEVRWRKQLDGICDQIAGATSESMLKALVSAHNQLVRQVNSLGTGALKASVTTKSPEEELRKLRERERGRNRE